MSIIIENQELIDQLQARNKFLEERLSDQRRKELLDVAKYVFCHSTTTSYGETLPLENYELVVNQAQNLISAVNAKFEKEGKDG